MVNMTNIISIKWYSKDFKTCLLQELGYNSDGTHVVDKNGNPVLDRYTKEPVQITNMAILPDKQGDAVILNDNPLNIICYLTEFEK